MSENKDEEQYTSSNEQDNDVQFRTVDDILAYYGSRNASNSEKTEHNVN